jgi:hypothetical protein
MNFPILARTLLATVLLTPAASLAQAPPQSKSPAAPPKAVHDPNACADSKVTTGKGGDTGQAQQDTGQAQKDRSLSDKLAQSKGVICPPRHVDEDIKAPTPKGGRMPVIPPPGSPGGNPNIQPK